MSSSEHIYNLKAVVLETGIKADTIRAWERRFDLPKPERTKGGHRRYSRSDINILRWLHAQLERGLSISSAVAQYRSLLDSGQDPLLAPSSLPGSLLSRTATSLQELREAWTEACLAFQETRAENALDQAFAHFPADQVVLELLLEGLAEIGQAWVEGRASVQQEHFTSQLVVRRLETLIATSPGPTQRQKLLIALPRGEDHFIASLTLDYLLRQRGYAVTNLGTSVPLERVCEALNTVQPSLITLSAQTLMSANELRRMAQLISDSGFVVGFGGRFFNLHPQARQVIPGYFLADNLGEVPDAIEQLLRRSPPPVSMPPTINDDASRAIEAMELGGHDIERTLWADLREEGWKFFDLNRLYLRAHAHILDALELGSITYLSTSFEEILTGLHVEGISGEQVRQFLDAFTAALEQHAPRSTRQIIDHLWAILTLAPPLDP